MRLLKKKNIWCKNWKEKEGKKIHETGYITRVAATRMKVEMKIFFFSNGKSSLKKKYKWFFILFLKKLYFLEYFYRYLSIKKSRLVKSSKWITYIIFYCLNRGKMEILKKLPLDVKIKKRKRTWEEIHETGCTVYT